MPKNSLVVVLCLGMSWVLIGCKFEVQPIPSNADAKERAAVVALRPLAENIGWDGDGNVQSVHLIGDEITDTTLAHVAQLTELETLGVMGRVTNQGLAQLSGLRNLTALGLQWTPITDDGLIHLRDIPSLRLIDLSHTDVSNAGLKHLEEMPNLNRLFIAGTRITEDGVRRFQQAVPGCFVQSDFGVVRPRETEEPLR